MKNNLIKLFLTLLLTSTTLIAVEPGSAEEKAKGKKWIPTPIEGKPNALIIGDSISIGYTLQVRELLEGQVNLYRPILEGTDQPWNCGHTSSINAGLDRMLKGPKWDVIHFNTGLHDLKRINRKKGARSDDPSVPVVISLEKYRAGLEQLVLRLKATGAKVIFATTTPYVEGVYPCRIPEDAVKYNEVALEVMKKHGVSINDLYSECLPNLTTWQQAKNVHFNELGKQKLAELVAKSISSEL